MCRASSYAEQVLYQLWSLQRAIRIHWQWWGMSLHGPHDAQSLASAQPADQRHMLKCDVSA